MISKEEASLSLKDPRKAAPSGGGGMDIFLMTEQRSCFMLEDLLQQTAANLSVYSHTYKNPLSTSPQQPQIHNAFVVTGRKDASEARLEASLGTANAKINSRPGEKGCGQHLLPPPLFLNFYFIIF